MNEVGKTRLITAELNLEVVRLSERRVRLEFKNLENCDRSGMFVPNRNVGYGADHVSCRIHM